MSERFNPSFAEKKISRKRLLQLGAASAIFYGTRRLEQGVKVKPYDIHPEDFEQSSESVVAVRRKIEEEAILASLSRPEWPNGNPMESESNYKLFVGTLKDEKVLFKQHSQIKVGHRSGNSIEDIDKAHAQGIQIFDIDANRVNKKTYGEHGWVAALGIGDKSIELFVIDENEGEFKLGAPSHEVWELVSHIGKKSTPEWPLAVSMELKRGVFEPDSLKELFDTFEAYGVPALINPRKSKVIEAASTVRNLSPINSVMVVSPLAA